MPIEIFTGLPGHGKTTFMVKRLLEEARKPPEKQRPLWAAGIDGLKPGIASILKDPREWNAVKPGETCTCHDTENSEACNAHVIPNGSLIFIDEAWKWFGHLQDASRQPAPPHVFQLAEHRHRGIDFVWTTQMPSQLYPFARALVADHHHHVRRFGTSFVDVFTWAELNDDVKSASKRDSALRKTVALDSEAHGHYKSAETHTIKRRLPWRVVLLPVLALAAIGCGWFVYTQLANGHMAKKLAAKEAASGAAATSDGSAPGQHAGKPMSAFEYAQRFVPRFGTMPETAPAFDDRPVVNAPELYCVAADAGLDANGDWQEASELCLSEQGTVMELRSGEARRVALHGRPYNYTKPMERQERQQQLDGVQGRAPAAMAPRAAPAVTGTSQPFGTGAAYGEIGVGNGAP